LKLLINEICPILIKGSMVPYQWIIKLC
jgi:hypothetical protein